MNLQKQILIFILILGFGSVFENFYPKLVMILEVLVILMLLRQRNKIRLLGHTKIYLLGFLVCTIVSAVMTATSITRYLSFIVRPIIALIILNIFQYNYKEIKYYFYLDLRIIAWLAFANIFVTIIFKGFFLTITSSSGYTVHTIGFVFNYIITTIRFGLEFTRNQGIFWEPGVLEIFMNTLVFIELFEYKSKINKIWLPVIIVISTASTSGYILLSILLLIWYLKRIKLAKVGKKKKISIILSAILMIGILYPIVKEEIKYKTTTGVGSTNKRTFDLLMGFKIASQHPLFGIGPDENRYKQQSNANFITVGDNVTYDARGNSNLFSMLFCSYGFIFAILFLYVLYKQNIFIHKKIYFLIVLIGLFSEPVAFTELYFIWIMSGAYIEKNHNLKKLYQKKTLPLGYYSDYTI